MITDYNRLLHAIETRRSVRNFDRRDIDISIIDRQLRPEVLPGLPIEGKETPRRFKIILLHAGEDMDRIKLGSYGVIRGARNAMILISCGDKEHTDAQNALNHIAAAYAAEFVVLSLVSEGIASCWMAGTLSRELIAKRLGLKDDDKILAAIPIGYPARHRSLVEKIMATAVKSRSRKPFETLFKLQPDCRQSIVNALECVRLAPSGCNRQPWRAIQTPDKLISIYCDGNMSEMNHLDMGIALAHFVIGCKGDVSFRHENGRFTVI